MISFRHFQQNAAPGICACLALLLASGCGERVKAPAPEAPFLAQVGGLAISPGDFEKELARRQEVSPGHYETAAQREAVLNEMIQFEALFARAKADGLDRDPEMQDRFRRMVVAKYREKYLPDAESAPLPNAAEVEAYYHAHSTEFTRGERAHAALIQVKISSKGTAERRKEIISQMEGWRREAAEASSKTPGFGDLARLHSEDAASRYRGGDVGWIARQQPDYAWPPEVVAAIFKLQTVGEISPVIEAADGIYLVKLMERSAPGPEPLANVRDRIGWNLRQRRIESRKEQFEAKTKANLNIVINQVELAKIGPPGKGIARGPVVPPAMPQP